MPNRYIFALAILWSIVVAIQSAPSYIQTKSTTEIPDEIVESTWSYPYLLSYEYMKTDDGYEYNFVGDNGVTREEKLEVVNKGTPDEKEVISGIFQVKGDDGYKYFVRYTIDKEGTKIDVDRAPIRRIPPGALKSLVG